MKPSHLLISAFLLVSATQAPPPQRSNAMELGNFSVSLSVSDINASKAFYEKLGFVQVFGDVAQRWVIMRNGDVKIGLFQGMFPRNTLTFNPGWDHEGNNTETFEDIRVLQRRLREAGIDTGAPIESSSGPAHFAVTDPDGNPILIDQHR